MASLDELLALLPDNDAGAIDASDLRAIVTDLFGRSGVAVVSVVTGAEPRPANTPVVIWKDTRPDGEPEPDNIDHASDIWLHQTA